MARKEGIIEIQLTGQPRDNEANMEIIKGLGKLTGRDVSIIKGAKSNKKLIAVEGLSEAELEKLL